MKTIFSIIYEQTMLQYNISALKQYMPEESFQKIYSVFGKSKEEIDKIYESSTQVVEEFSPILSTALKEIYKKQSTDKNNKQLAADMELLKWLNKTHSQYMRYYRSDV